MLLVIQVKDGVPIEHPISIDNLKLFDPSFDINKLPEGLEIFERIDPPPKSRFQYYVARPYKKVNGVWTDDWEIVDIPDEEKKAIIKKEQENFIYKDTWKWDEETLNWIPPVPFPTDENKHYKWNNEKIQWDEISSEEYQNLIEMINKES